MKERKEFNVYRTIATSSIILFSCAFLFSCSRAPQNVESRVMTQGASVSSEPTAVRTLDLQYAKGFRVVFYSDDSIRVFVQGEENELVLFPKDSAIPSGLKPIEGKNLQIARYPIENVYLAASSATDLFLRLDSLDKIAACSTKASDYAIEAMAERIERGDCAYVGKYGAPDFETLLALGCELAIESTMIHHSPKTKEQLERLGTAVFVERASYEEEPLGRLEWIKLYGVLLGKEKEAVDYFDAQKAKVDAILAKRSASDSRPKSVALFYVSSNGYVNVRRPGDYFCKLVELAGGSYAFDNLDLNVGKISMQTISLNWEDFYRVATEADALIYNGTVDSNVESIDDLIGKNPLFADLNAVKEGNVWRANMTTYQESSRIAELVEAFYDVLNGTPTSSHYMLKLN